MSQERLAQTNRMVREYARRRLHADSRDRLKRIAKRKFTTTFIYALDAFERTFGHLWGRGSPPESLSDDQKHNYASWQDIRKQILDCGNAQYRGFANELDLHEVSFEGYQAHLPRKG